MKSSVNDSLGELTSLTTPVPNTRVIEYFLDSIIFNEILVFIKTAFYRHHRESEIWSVVSTERALTKHAVSNHTACIGTWCVEEVSVLVGVIFPTNQIAVY